MFGKIPLITAQICGIGIVSLALGLLSFRFYEQQSALVKIYESEALGASLATEIMDRLIEVSVTDHVSPDMRQRILQTIEQAYKSDFTKAVTHANNFESSAQPGTSSQAL
ncbi:MAG: hypothetical protein ACXWC9_03970, partial [Pseudobdellovibrionaceae bacterium]